MSEIGRADKDMVSWVVEEAFVKDVIKIKSRSQSMRKMNE